MEIFTAVSCAAAYSAVVPTEVSRSVPKEFRETSITYTYSIDFSATKHKERADRTYGRIKGRDYNKEKSPALLFLNLIYSLILP